MTIAKHDADAVNVVEASEEQGRDLFEENCQRELGVSSEDFLAAHDAGEYPDGWDDRAIQRVEFLLPFVR